MARGRGVCRLSVPDRRVVSEAVARPALCRADEDDPDERDKKAQQLLRKMLAAGVSALRPRPAEGAGRGETKVIPLEAIAEPMSAFGGKADMPFCTAHVRF